MIEHLSDKARIIGFGLAIAAASASRVQAQTNDEARLTIGIAGGFLGSSKLWDVANQPIYSQFNEPDIFHLHREMHSDITISAHATYFPGPHFGFTAEFTFLGLGTTDACTVVHDNGNVELLDVCSALEGTLGSASTTVVHAGMVYRPLTRSFLQPYLKASAGIAFTPSSTVALQSTYGHVGDTALFMTIYKDDDWKAMRPSWTLGFGLSTAPSSGYQIHVEVRETWLALGVVNGPTYGQGFVPDHSSALKGYPSILVGFDVVLARQRGRRY